MKALDIADIHCLRAAQGWLELGSAAEASAELANIRVESRDHPAVLEMRWQIYVQELNWDAAKEIARTIVTQMPDEPDGWLHLSYATRRATDGSVRAAWDVLHPVAKKFPSEPLISYNLACYACQLGLMDIAREWLRKAFVAEKAKSLGESRPASKYKVMALQDSDLKPLWMDIGEM
ncbi:MAG TPA: tetratricopeptide repeat protein [Verrucomicrobiae bacterium]|nr:tetratricopeptide repeat protein [Verrucomicrobiae bacterium]